MSLCTWRVAHRLLTRQHNKIMSQTGGILREASCFCRMRTVLFPHKKGLPFITTTSSYAKVSKGSSRVKNLAFVRKWNKENTLIYGKLLKGKKGRPKLKKTKEIDASSDNYMNTDQLSSLHEAVHKTDSQVPVKDLQKVDTPYVDKEVDHSSKIRTDDDLSENTSDSVNDDQKKSLMQDLEPIVRFPLFVPELDLVNQGVIFQDDVATDIPVLGEERFVSVSQILNKTKSKESQFVLNRWIQGQIEILGREGFSKAQKDRLRAASTFHGCVEQYLSGTPVHLLNIEPEVQPYWESLATALQSIEEVWGVEVKVEHSKLRYHGTADCVGQYKGEACVMEWKTSSKPKASVSSLYEYPLQVASYLGGLQYNSNQESKDVPKVENMLIVVAYEDGSPAHSHFISRRQSMQYWASWCQRLHMYWKMKLSGEI